MPEEILNPSDFHVGWSAQSLAGDIYVIVKATDKTVTFDKYDTVWLNAVSYTHLTLPTICSV